MPRRKNNYAVTFFDEKGVERFVSLEGGGLPQGITPIFFGKKVAQELMNRVNLHGTKKYHIIRVEVVKKA